MRSRVPLGIFALGAVLVSTGAIATHSTSIDPDRVALPGSVPSWSDDWTGTALAAADRELDIRFSVIIDEKRADDVPEVAAWLTHNGLQAGDYRASAGILPATGTVDAVSAAFATSFQSYEVGGTDAIAPRSALSVPTELPAVVGVSGLVQADTFRPTLSSPRSDAERSLAQAPSAAFAAPAAPRAGAPVVSPDCATYWGEKLSDKWPTGLDIEQRSNSLCGYTPAQLRAVQQVPADVTGVGATIAIVAAYDDLDVEANTNTYFTAQGEQPFAPGQYVSHSPSNPDPTRCGGPSSWTEEQHLDVQAVHAMAPDARVIYWGSDDCTTTSMFTRILDAVENGDPDVISLSFGALEELDTADDRTLLNRVLVEAAARNISVFSSAGNDGDYSNFGDHAGGAEVTSPASSPYITAVGGTSTGLNQDGSLAVEAGWETQTRFARNGAIIPPGFVFGSGGGESVVYDRPSWQLDLPGQTGTGRLLPDVASLADPNTGFTVYGPHAGSTQYVSHGGTSLATPMVASMVALAKAKTGVEVGLATPSLYALAGTDALRDVTPASAATWSPNGTEKDALYPETIFVWDTKPQSLQSARGWDNVTGLGVPTGSSFIENFGKLK